MTTGQSAAPWWQSAVVYQIYPRSFCDSNGDGLGDLAGIASKLDYVSDLGVKAVWLSPIYPSPNRDFGYDVADYTDISSDYGTLEQFDAFLAEAHKRGLKIILDQVLSHSSDLHPWFQDSIRKRNGKDDWYVWGDPKLDGTPPNNWLSVFGGPAWSYHPARRQYYFHKFLKQQPKLNLTNPDVADAMLSVLAFWLDRGVDGFRLDVANSFLHDAALRDNPPIPMAERKNFDWGHADRLQEHVYDSNRPDNLAFITRIRKLVDSYGDRFVFGEFAEKEKLLGTYAGGEDGLHSGYTFSLLHRRRFDKAAIENEIRNLAAFDHLWPCNTFSNHDVMRIASRWKGAPNTDRAARLALMLLFTMRGTPLLYQGEELGLPDVDIAFEQVKDPIGLLYYPDFKGRDGCRTPIPWRAAAANAGFSSGTPWLPVGGNHVELAADRQVSDERSVRAFSEKVIAVRQELQPLALGDIALWELDPMLVCYKRSLGDAHVLCLFNLTNEPRSISLPEDFAATAPCLTVGDIAQEDTILAVGPFSAAILA